MVVDFCPTTSSSLSSLALIRYVCSACILSLMLRTLGHMIRQQHVKVA